MPPTEPSLFDPDALPPPRQSRSLVIRSGPGHPLGKEERAFNRALARLQALSRALDAEKQRLDRLLVFHAAEIRPRTYRVLALQSDLVRALVPFLDDRRLTKGQRRILRRIVIDQLDGVLASSDEPASDLEALFERLHNISYARARQDDLAGVQVELAAMLDELGLDIDVSELRAVMTEEDFAAATARLAHAIGDAEAKRRRADNEQPSRGKARRAGAARAQRDEQVRKDSLGAVYRRLVKELHPDLERDPAERERKSRIMQDITAAYSGGNLHALLQIELEWLNPVSGDATRLSSEKLRAYTRLLTQQATELQGELQSLRLHPRYFPLIVEGPFGMPLVIDGPRELKRLDNNIEQIRFAIERLSSNEALQEVRGAIREYRDSEKRRERLAITLPSARFRRGHRRI
jgi:hypothetical protein